MRLLLLPLCFGIVLSIREFRLGSKSFVKDGEDFQIISGSLHYYNVPEDLWEDRLTSMRNCGVNTVQTYIEWRTLEPMNSIFDFTGRNNITRFIKTAQKVGLLVNIRLGPYIDSEREMGGLPWWLLQVNPEMKLRSSDPEFVKYASRFWSRVLPELEPLLYSNGGPIVLVQVENEYGSYSACDFVYTAKLRDLAISILGDDVVYYTTDGAGDAYLKCGKNEGLFATVDFGVTNSVTDSFAAQRRHQRDGPFMNSEFYTGWLDHWGELHNEIPTSSVVRSLDKMLSMNASVNMYMFHGGTHFGFDNGANLGGKFQPCPTSYDYDAPLTEAGDPTEKYFAIKNVISKYAPVPSANPTIKPKAVYGNVTLKKFIDLEITLGVLRNLKKAKTSKDPMSFESLGHPYGLVAYETVIAFRPFSPSVLKVPGLRDRGYVYVDHQLVGILSREVEAYEIPLNLRLNQTLTILVENQGRVCFGDGIKDPKGILQRVELGERLLENWENIPLPEESQSFRLLNALINDVSIRKQSQSSKGFGAYHGTFEVSRRGNNPLLDTYLRLDGWGKGFAYINDVNIGRYWPNQGPQVTLYVPSVYLKVGQNNVTLVELENSPNDAKISFVDKPVIDGLVPE